MDLIGRKSQREMLEYCEASDKSELVCVYGRRRVGKTYLVEQTLSPFIAFHAVGTKNTRTSKLLREFSLELFDRGDPNPEPAKDWREAFNRLYKVITSPSSPKSPHGKAVVFLDEFPWFANQGSDFLDAFSAFWNRRSGSGQKLLVVLCGSATSWVIDRLLECSDGLAARITSSLYLEPFTLKETAEYFQDRGFGWDDETALEAQMVFGGLPYFFSLMHPNQSLWENIDRLCLAPRAQLRDETTILLESTMRQSKIYLNLFEVLAQHKYGMRKQEVCELLGYSVNRFTAAVSEAVKCGYIREYRNPSKPYHPKYIQLVDPFILFHFHFISPSKGSPPDSWSDFAADAGRFGNWRGNAFEIVCLYHVEQLKAALGINGVKTVEYPWLSKQREGGAQIDLVIERADRIVNLCEMKFLDGPYQLTKAAERELARKRDVFRGETGIRHALKTVLVAPNGATGSHRRDVSKIITLEDLFRF